ncbi:MAG TPA: NAD-glutamate dehydrogenase, partial [Kiloniellaceae bacterium]|nr:NAD-glutamate dehydrogenase [Kiloniellaceae bacterium]
HPIVIDRAIADFGKGIALIAQQLESFLSESDVQMLEDRAARFEAEGAPKVLARRIADLALLAPACDVVRIAHDSGLPVETVARTYFTVGKTFGFDWLRRAAGQLSTDTAWDKLAVTAIVDDFLGHQSELTARVLDGKTAKADVDSSIEGWAVQRRPLILRSEQLVQELKAAGTLDLAMLAVANRQLKSMVAG